jgi:hypothetical protein
MSRAAIWVVALLTLALVLLAIEPFLMRSDLGGASRDSANQRIRSAQATVKRVLDQRTLSQAFMARALAEGPLGVVLDTLDRHRGDMLAAWKAAEADVPQDSQSPQQALLRRQAFLGTYPDNETPLPTFFARALADRLEARMGQAVFGPEGRAAFEAGERERFVHCLTISPSQCFWDFPFVTLIEEMTGISDIYNLPFRHRVIITDAKGVGLADSGNPRWSDAAQDAYPNELARAARQTGLPQRDLLLHAGVQHLATAVPIQLDGRILGSVVVADPINRWMAREDAEAIGADVSFALGTTILDSSLDPVVAQRLALSLDADPGRVAFSFPISGLMSGQDLRVILSIAPEVPATAHGMLRFALIVIVALLLIVAGLLVQFRSRRLRERLVSLHQGVQEVLNGNVEHEFPSYQDDPTLAGLAESLNLINFAIRGNTMNDDDESSIPHWGSWQLKEDVCRDPESPGDNELEFQHSQLIEQLRVEPANDYYRRLFNDFLAARTSAGLDNSDITQRAFMQRVVRLEQRLKERHSCNMVRFVVRSSDGDVRLEPVRMD